MTRIEYPVHHGLEESKAYGNTIRLLDKSKRILAKSKIQKQLNLSKEQIEVVMASFAHRYFQNEQAIKREEEQYTITLIKSNFWGLVPDIDEQKVDSLMTHMLEENLALASEEYKVKYNQPALPYLNTGNFLFNLYRMSVQEKSKFKDVVSKRTDYIKGTFLR